MLSLTDKFTLPFMCWLAPKHLGDLTRTRFHKQLLPDMVLSTYWASGEMKKEASQNYKNILTFNLDFCQCLRLWKKEFDLQQPCFNMYHVDADGQIQKAPKGDFRRYKQSVIYCQERLALYMRVYAEGGGFAHELRVFREILSMITVNLPLDERFHTGMKSPKWQLMLASLRIEVVEPCLMMCLEEMQSVFTANLQVPLRSNFVTDAMQAIGGYMARLQALQICDGRWEDLNTAEHHVVIFADLDEDICSCGKRVRSSIGRWSNEVRQITIRECLFRDTMY